MNYKQIDLNIFGDLRGSLISLEANRNIPFDIKRVYYIFDTKPEIERGKHAHKNLEQVIVCISGSCKFLLDNGITKEIVELARPDRALYIGKNMWREMFDFSYGCVLMVLANEYYNADEYIRDYEQFKKIVETKI